MLRCIADVALPLAAEAMASDATRQSGADVRHVLRHIPRRLPCRLPTPSYDFIITRLTHCLTPRRLA